MLKSSGLPMVKVIGMTEVPLMVPSRPDPTKRTSRSGMTNAVLALLNLFMSDTPKARERVGRLLVSRIRRPLVRPVRWTGLTFGRMTEGLRMLTN